MTENDDILIRNFFEQNSPALSDEKKFRRRVIARLPRRYSIADRLTVALMAAAVVVVAVWWFASGSWFDTIVNVVMGIKIFLSTLQISMAAILNILIAVAVIACLAFYDFFYNQKYNIE